MPAACSHTVLKGSLSQALALARAYDVCLCPASVLHAIRTKAEGRQDVGELPDLVVQPLWICLMLSSALLVPCALTCLPCPLLLAVVQRLNDAQLLLRKA